MSNEKLFFCSLFLFIVKTYPPRNTSATFNIAEFIRMGKGYFSKSRGNFTIASHCKPICPERRAVEEKKENDNKHS